LSYIKGERIFEPKKEEETVDWREVFEEERTKLNGS
jgi:hypothetical protein